MPVLLPDRLVDAVRQRKCILFVGSGLSIAAGHPTWDELVAAFVSEGTRLSLGHLEGIEDLVQARDLVSLLGRARRIMGPTNSADLLETLLSDDVAPSSLHAALASTDYRAFITTNYDRLIENGFVRTRRTLVSTFAGNAVSALPHAVRRPEPFLFKLHGDPGTPEALVLSTEDCDHLVIDNPHVRVFLQSVFLNHTVLFVGYGLVDPDFQMLMRELSLIFKRFIPSHYALLANAGSFEMDHLLARMNVRVLSYDPADNHRAVGEVLEELRQVAPYRPAADRRIA